MPSRTDSSHDLSLCIDLGQERACVDQRETVALWQAERVGMILNAGAGRRKRDRRSEIGFSVTNRTLVVAVFACSLSGNWLDGLLSV